MFFDSILSSSCKYAQCSKQIFDGTNLKIASLFWLLLSEGIFVKNKVTPWF